MIPTKKKGHLVSFRVSEEEYESIQRLAMASGARSLAGFARRTLTDVVDEALRRRSQPPSRSDLVLSRRRNF